MKNDLLWFNYLYAEWIRDTVLVSELVLLSLVNHKDHITAEGDFQKDLYS